MSFTIERTLFNEDQKNRFLDEKYPNESTRMTNTSILKNVGRFEHEKNKDLSKFSYEEVKELLIGMKKKSLKSLGVAYTIIMQYLDWCLAENHSSMNVLKLVDKKEDLPKYIHQVAQKLSYITREQMYDYCDMLYNYADKSMLALLFETVRGRPIKDHTFEELRNIKKTDLIPESNTIIVTRDPYGEILFPQSRPITVDPRTMEILQMACLEDTYHKLNGLDDGRFAILPTKDTPYILRTIGRKNNTEERITVGNIGARFKNFRQYTKIRFLNPTLIFQSGLLDRCLKKENEVGELTSENFRQLFRDLQLDERGWQGLKEMYETYKQTQSIVPN